MSGLLEVVVGVRAEIGRGSVNVDDDKHGGDNK